MSELYSYFCPLKFLTVFLQYYKPSNSKPYLKLNMLCVKSVLPLFMFNTFKKNVFKCTKQLLQISRFFTFQSFVFSLFFKLPSAV